MTMDAGTFAQAHLDLRLAALNRVCAAAVLRQQREAAQLDRPDLAAQTITDRHVAVLLERVRRLGTGSPGEPAVPALTAADLKAEARLRAEAAAADVALP